MDASLSLIDDFRLHSLLPTPSLPGLLGHIRLLPLLLLLLETFADVVGAGLILGAYQHEDHQLSPGDEPIAHWKSLKS